MRARRIAVFAAFAAVTPLWVGTLPTPWSSRGGSTAGATGLAAPVIRDLPAGAYAFSRYTGADLADHATRWAADAADDAPIAGAPADEPARPAPAAPKPPPKPRTRVVRMRVTAYCPCRRCCGKFSDGRTASGRSIRTNGSAFVAADTSILPFHTRLSVPGYYGGAPVPVLDRGRDIRGYRLDVFFRSHERARRWGTRWLDVVVYE